MAGRSPAFTPEETELLRSAARRLKEDRQWSQGQLGEALGIEQQNAGRFTKTNSTATIGRRTATNLAKALGFGDVEELLLHELAEGAPDLMLDNRTRAAKLALKIGYRKEVVDAVLSRYAAPEHAAQPLAWWINLFVFESVSSTPREVLPPTKASDPPKSAARELKKKGKAS